VGAALSLNPFFNNDPRGRNFDPAKRIRQPGFNIAYVGKAHVPDRKSTVSDQSAYNYADHFPSFNKYKLPSMSPMDEKHVLDNLCANIRSETEDAKYFLGHANDVISDATPTALKPAWFHDGIPRVDDVLNAIRQQNRVKHPGFPGCLLGANKGVVIDRYLPDLVQAIQARIVCLRVVGPYCATPEDFYRTYCSDLVSFSIKREVIKRDKDGRGLCAMSIVTSCVEFLLYGQFDVAFKQMKFETYSAIGIGFTLNDSKLLHAASPKPAMLSDVPKFDSSVTLEENTLSADVAMRKQGCVPADDVYVIATILERTLAMKMFILSNGHIYVQLLVGYQSTGRNETSNFNTMNRARRAYAVDIRLLIFGSTHVPDVLCAGDDGNETPHPDKLKTYLELGFPLRDVVVSNALTFCSHDWPEGETPVGQRIHKSLFKLFLKLPIDAERFVAFSREYYSHSEYPALVSIIFAVRPEMKYVLQEMSFQVFNDDRTATTFADDDAPDYDACTRSKKANKKVTIAPPVRKLSKPKIRGRGDYEVEPTPKGLSSALSRIEGKVDRALHPPASSLARMGGRALGSLIGQGDLGATAGDALSKWMGYGDYNIVSNSLVPGKQPNGLAAGSNPVEFYRHGKRGTRVIEREYVCDIKSGALSGSASVFTNQSFRINPADPATFPWLSSVAQGYEEYEILGMIFEFKSTSSTFNGASQALGTVIMSTDYDPVDAPYSTKLQMENADYACSTAASTSMVHGIECDRSELPTKVLFTSRSTPPSGQDLRFYDLANFQIATVGMSTAGVNVGELWVSYDMVLYKKELLAGQLGGQAAIWTSQASAGISASQIFRSNPQRSGTLVMTIAPGGNNNAIAFPASYQTGTYRVAIYLIGTTVTAPSGLNYTNCVAANNGYYNVPSGDATLFPITLGNGTAASYREELVLITAQNASVAWKTDAVTTGSSHVLIVVEQVAPALLPALT